jgi:hypothetical protein
LSWPSRLIFGMPAVICKYSCITETDIKVFLTLCNYINISKNFFKGCGIFKTFV